MVRVFGGELPIKEQTEYVPEMWTQTRTPHHLGGVFDPQHGHIHMTPDGHVNIDIVTQLTATVRIAL